MFETILCLKSFDNFQLCLLLKNYNQILTKQRQIGTWTFLHGFYLRVQQTESQSPYILLQLRYSMRNWHCCIKI